MNFGKKAEEVLLDIIPGEWGISDRDILSTALEQAYKEGVEEMAKCAQACLWGDRNHDTDAIDEELYRLLSKSEEVK